MTTTEFVAAMNAKAKSWGLTETTFVDVHGLDPKNVSSTSDIAIIASHAFHDYPLLKKASLTTVYNFRTVNTKIAHSIATTDKLLLSPGKLTITGNKTGYLDEAKYTYALRVANKQGAQIIVVVFGEPTSALRFSDAAKLASWSLTAFSWK
jgi:D-alanyl-D-alanine endopeptidase (penicillin-binding protein 7)